jgi:hypothetical protein
VNDSNIIQFPRGRDQFGLIRYPYLGIRLGFCAGERLPIAISKGPYSFTLKKGDTRLVHPEPFNSDGSASAALRADLLWEAVQLVRRSWRPTVHWSEDESSTVWADAIHNRVRGEDINLPFDVNSLTRSDASRLLGALRLGHREAEIEGEDLSQTLPGAVILQPHVVAARNVDVISPQHQIVATEYRWGNPMRLCIIRENGTLSLGWRYHDSADVIPEEWRDEDGEYIAERAADEGTYDAFKLRGVLDRLHLPAFIEGQPICGVDYTDTETLLTVLSDEDECGIADHPLPDLKSATVQEALDALGWGGWGGGTDEERHDTHIVDRVIAAASAESDSTCLSPEIIKAYLEAEYVIEASDHIALAIGGHSPRLEDLYVRFGNDTVTVITAWNAEGVERGDNLNTMADAHLRTDIRDLGLPSLEAQGESGDSSWPVEQGHAIFGLNLKEAVHLGRVHGQNAIVWASADAIPKLVLLR